LENLWTPETDGNDKAKSRFPKTKERVIFGFRREGDEICAPGISRGI
jgi:hypothetical protein